MTKTVINQLISHMQKAGIVTKAAPWMIEGFGEKEMNVRYVGIKPTGDWLGVVPGENNFLLKFIFDKKTSVMEFYIANKPPFLKLITKRISITDKWEVLLGEIRHRLKEDKGEYLSHKDKVGNLYVLLKNQLK